jgi:hypothetical protein
MGPCELVQLWMMIETQHTNTSRVSAAITAGQPHENSFKPFTTGGGWVDAQAVDALTRQQTGAQLLTKDAHIKLNTHSTTPRWPCQIFQVIRHPLPGLPSQVCPARFAQPGLASQVCSHNGLWLTSCDRAAP